MGKRGPNSKAGRELSVIDGGGQTAVIRRPMAPRILSEAEADIWRETVGALPADYWDAKTYPLLVNYCREVARADRIAQALRKFEENIGADEMPDLETWRSYGILMESAIRSITALSSKMRLSHQAAAKQTDRRTREGKRPWDSQ